MSQPTYRIGDEPDLEAETTAGTFDPFAPPTPDEVAGVSVMEQLAATLAEDVDDEPHRVKVPKRAGITLVFKTTLSNPDRKAWQKRSTRKKRGLGGAEEVDEMMFAQLVIANQCIGVELNGVEAHDEEGTPITFRHRKLWDMVKATTPPQAILNLFQNDAHVLIASGEVLMACGFDDDLSADPTGQESANG